MLVITDIQDKYEKLSQKTEMIEMENKLLKENVENLETRIISLEQHSRASNIIISGYPQKENEECKDIVEKIAGYLKIKIKVQESHRMNFLKKHSNIIARLEDKQQRRAMVKGARNLKRIIKAGEIEQGLGNSAIYINEHLSNEIGQVYYQTRKMKKENLIKETWHDEGKVFIKVEEGSKKLMVNSLKKLEKLHEDLKSAKPVKE